MTLLRLALAICASVAFTLWVGYTYGVGVGLVRGVRVGAAMSHERRLRSVGYAGPERRRA